MRTNVLEMLDLNLDVCATILRAISSNVGDVRNSLDRLEAFGVHRRYRSRSSTEFNSRAFP